MNKTINIAFFCVNFNSYPEMTSFLSSINESRKKFKDNLVIEVFIADNSSDNIQEIDISSFQNINIIIYPFHKNLGYMGAIMQLIREIGYEKVKEYDFVIMSNVDLILSDSFFDNLCKQKLSKDIGWIAPQIFSLSEKRDRNPKILRRPSAKRLELLMLMYKYPFLYRIYNGLIYPFRKKKLESLTINKIYAGHGSLMIFTKTFMKQHASFKFPSFLFGEEIFFGELSRSSNLDVIYNPQIVVNDFDHASTSKLKRRSYCKMNYESLNKLKPLLENE